VVQEDDGCVGIDAPLDLDRQGLAGVLIDHVEQLNLLSSSVWSNW
jgi:hypothetical protein